MVIHLNPENFYEDVEDFKKGREAKARSNYQFKAALPFIQIHNIEKSVIEDAKEQACHEKDFLEVLKQTSQFPCWFFADREAGLRSAEYILDREKLINSSAFLKFLDCAAGSQDSQAALVFTVPGHGLWVLHNLPMTYRNRIMYMVIPSSGGATDLHILKHRDFCKEFDNGN